MWLSPRRKRLVGEFIRAFVAVNISSHENYDIDIYKERTTKLLTPIIGSLVIWKVLIQNKNIQWFMARTLRSAFVQGIVRVGYSPSLLYYELLVSHMSSVM